MVNTVEIVFEREYRGPPFIRRVNIIVFNDEQ